MLSVLCGFAQSVVDPAIRAVLQSILGDPEISEPLKVAPAAVRLHHAYRCGLIEHVVSICQAAELVVRRYPRLNRDWLIAGAIVHDLGKIEELGTSRRSGYTTRGQLLGHVAIGLGILEKHPVRFPDLRPEIRTILQHLIISHDGEVEKGALRLPMFPEALALYYLDELDARLEQTWRIIGQTPAGEELTAYAPSLERQLYRGPLVRAAASVAKDGKPSA
jgi:3'-5' exoribonuclease